MNTTVSASAIIGTLDSELFYAPPGLWDRGSKVLVKVSSGQLSSVSMTDVLNGSNIVAVGDGSSENWEIVQFASALLVSPDKYEISMLLRGLAGTDAVCPTSWPINSLFVVIDGLVPQINLPFASRGLERFYRVGPLDQGYSNSNAITARLAFNGIGLRPYSVSHLEAFRSLDGAISVSWIRRTRIDGDSWLSTEVPLAEETEQYLVRIQVGDVIYREEISFIPSYIYSSTMQSADGIGVGFMISVAQNSNSFGNGPFVRIDIVA